MLELNTDLRHHVFLPPELEASIPALYATEEIPMMEKTVYAHYLVGVCDWWIFELDPDEMRAFGFVCLGDEFSAEAGYISLFEVENLVLHAETTVNGLPATIPLVVERDLEWVPRPVSEAIPERLHAYWWKQES